jgi:lipopolysaccharide transport protein LptA
MASSTGNSRFALVALGLLCLAPPAHAQSSVSLDNCNDPINIESDKAASFNLRTNRVEFGKVKITGCDASITANSARTTSVDVEDSVWTFDGDVRITISRDQGSLRSDQAVVTFRNNQMQRVEIEGSPAELEQKRGQITTRGRASKIVYDLSSSKVSLNGDAWVSDGGRTDVKAESLVYNLRTQNLDVSGSGSGRPFTMTIDPRLAKKKNDDEKRQEPSPPAPKNDTPPRQPLGNQGGGSAAPRSQ